MAVWDQSPLAPSKATFATDYLSGYLTDHLLLPDVAPMSCCLGGV
jgi:hypothetical protein